MTNLKAVIVLALASLALPTSAAFANDASVSMSKSEPTVQSKRIVTKIEPQSRLIVTKASVETKTSSAVAKRNYITVKDEDGQTYYNRLISLNDLPDPELDVIRVKTFTYEHEGRVFKNQIVKTVG